MTMYEAVFEKLQERYESGELSFEDAERLNKYAYEKYMAEAKEASKKSYSSYTCSCNNSSLCSWK